MQTVVWGALSEIGRRALTRTPDQITLARVDSPAWTNGPAVEQQASPLRSAGLKDLGVYSVGKMPGVLIRMMHHPETYVAAHTYARVAQYQYLRPCRETSTAGDEE